MRTGLTPRALAPAAIGLALVAALRLWLELVGPLPLERWSRRFTPWPPRPQPWRDLVELFGILGTPLLAAVLVSCSVWLVWRGIGRRAALFLLLACAGVAVNGVLKVLFGPTPLWREAHQTLNYPSGHTVFAVCFAGALAVLAAQHRRWDLVLMAAVPIVLMGPLRVLGGTHLPSDVLAGYVFAGGWRMSAGRVVDGGRSPAAWGGPGPAGLGVTVDETAL